MLILRGIFCTQKTHHAKLPKTALRAVGEIAASFSSFHGWLSLSAIGGLAQGFAILLFIGNIWTRIKPVGKLTQEDLEPTPKRKSG